MAFRIQITAFSVILILFFLVLITKSVSSLQIRTTDSSDPITMAATEDCSGRWIYIRNLPSHFNLDLLANCSEHPLFDNFCPYLANHGLGHKTHNKCQSWYRTDTVMLELIFHRRILEYPCLTSDPNLANAVYLPYYAGIDALKYLYGPDVNSSMEHVVRLFEFLQSDAPEMWERYMGHDHFLVMARPAWDFSQPLKNDPPMWGTSFLELPELYNVTALVPKARPWPWQENSVPYPTAFHPTNLAFFEAWIQRVRRSKRSTLMLFAGGGGVGSTPNIRRSIRNECENDSSSIHTLENVGEYSKICEMVDCSNGICEHGPLRDMRPILQATFCLQPPGDNPTRRSTFDSIIAGCIPVFFEELSAKTQYVWHMPGEQYGEFSVFMPKEEVVSKGLRILDVLMGMPRRKVMKKRERVMELIPRIMYRRHGSSLGLRSIKDAFDIAVEGTLQKIKARIHNFSAQ